MKCLTSHVTFVISTFDLFEMVMDRENKTTAAKRKERPWPLGPAPDSRVSTLIWSYLNLIFVALTSTLSSASPDDLTPEKTSRE